MIRAVLFDCDGVLADSETLSNRIVAEELTALGWVLDGHAAQREFLGLSLPDMLPIIQGRVGAVPEGWGLALSHRIAREMEIGVQAMPGARAALEAVAAAGLPMAVCSNSARAELGMKMRVLATFVDSGGHFTQSVYQECAAREKKRVWAIKGEGGEGKPYVRPMKTSSGAVRFIIAVDSGKEAILYATGVDPSGDLATPRYMHFPRDYRAGYDIDYFKGLVAEKMVIHRVRGKAVVAFEKIYERNEPLDCRNYARAAFRYFNWNFDQIEKALSGAEKKKAAITRAQAEQKKNKHIISRGIQV